MLNSSAITYVHTYIYVTHWVNLNYTDFQFRTRIIIFVAYMFS